MRKKPYIIRFNYETREMLQNEEVSCRSCHLNFADIYTLSKHRLIAEDKSASCLYPRDVKMTPHVNTYASVVWKYSKW
jgi:hypothetical protein